MSSSSLRRPRRIRTVACAAVAAALASVTTTATVNDAQARTPTSKREAPRAESSAPENRAPRKAPPRAAPRPTLEPAVLPAEAGAPPVLVFPPYDTTAPRPIAVMLHGMCDLPEYECPYFADSIRQRRWLICPQASLRCEGGGAIWSFKKRAQTVDAAVERVHAAYPGMLDESAGRVLIGFSLGAITGMHLAHTGAGRWSSVILIGAKVHPNAHLLQRAGVDRLLMVAGDYDMMKWHMYQQAQRLERQGFTSAFLSLGRIGHWFPANMNTLMGQALAWAAGNDAALDGALDS